MSDAISRSGETAHQLLEAGAAASSRNESALAVRLFEQAVDAAPSWAMPHFMLGSEFAAMGDWAKAEGELANAVLLDPQLRIARYQLGLLQLTCGRAAAALVTWQPLLADAADDGLAEFVGGFSAWVRDDFDGAASQFRAGMSRPDVNPAAATDVQRTLDSIAHGPSRGDATAPPETSPSPSHVLVANYGKFVH